MPLTIPRRLLDIALPPYDPLNLRASELRVAGHDVISLGQALPFFGPPPGAALAACAAVQDGRAHGYTTDPGLPALRAVLADRLRDTCSADVRPDDLIVTAGANHAFALALNTLVDPGDEVVLPAPFFTNHEMMIRIAGAVAVEAPIADSQTFAITWKDIEPALTPRTRAVVLCNPGNPTGAPVRAEEGRRIVEELGRRGVILVSDETYMHFVYGGAHWSAASSPAWRENVVVVGTFSKSFGMMGWRVGFMLADAAVCAEAVKVQDAMIICAPTVSQIAAEAVVREDWNYATSFHDALLERRDALLEGLRRIPGWHWTPPGGAFFGFVRVPGCQDSDRLSRELLEQAHVVTIPGSAFGRCAEGHLRLSFGYASPDALGEALERIRRYFEES